ncbi:hypothetical protein TNCV_87251 [Trichonephila clavipes]|nr:hypothetical protein TNCV_87251 [Trichonephila clavipes]
MARKRAENREGSLGFPGFVTPVFTKDSKTPREKEKITGAPRERETRTHLKKSNTCGLVRGYDGFEIIESSPQTTAVPGNQGGHYCAALAPPLELEVEGPD